jgi:hypothetical protein
MSGPPVEVPPSDARATTASLITACWSTQVIHVAVRFGVPDQLARNVSSATEIASVVGAEPRAMFRLLRALTNLGLCRHLGDERFELTTPGQYLRSDVPDSLAVVARHWGGRTWSALGHLEGTLKTGRAWAHSGREGFFAMADKPDDAAVLNRSMAVQTSAVARAIVAAHDFSKYRYAIDLGGGYGALVSVLLQRYPQLHGASADLAYMESDAIAFLRQAGVAERAKFIATDFFQSVPAGADCYLLKFIVHDWDDEDALVILRNTAFAAGDKGTVLIIEQIMPERVAADPQHTTVVRGDIQMMVATGGMERTASEYRALLAAAGLKLNRIIPTASQFSIIEAAKKD